MKKLLLPTLLLFSILFMHCKDPVLNPNSQYKLYPINLKAEKLPSGDIKYSWNAINAAGFEGYVLLRSNIDSVPYFSTAQQLAERPTGVQLITTINDSKVTEFIDTSSILPLNVFTRIFAVVDGRVLSSTNVPVKGRSNITELNIKSIEVGFLPKLNLIALPDITTNTVSIFDVKANKMVGLSRNVGFSSNKEVGILETNIGNYFMMPFDDFNLVLINADNLNELRNVFNLANNSMITHMNNDYVISSNLNNITSMTMSNIKLNNTFTPFSSLFIPSDETFSGNIFLRKYNNGQKFCAIRRGNEAVKVTTFKFTENGTFDKIPTTIMSHKLVTNSTFNKAHPFSFTNDDAYFIIDVNGTVYSNDNLSKKIVLSEEVPTGTNIQYSEFVVDAISGDIYAMRQSGNSRANRKIDIFKYPSFTFKKSIDYISPATRMFLLDNKVVLISLSSSETTSTLIEYINL